MLREIQTNLKKDLVIEFRTKSALQVSVAFAVIITIATSLVSGGAPFSRIVHALLLWLIIFFSAMNGLIHIFSREEDRKTALLLRLYASPLVIYLAKLIFNCLMFFLLLGLIVPLYIFFLQVDIVSVPQFMLTLFCGGLALVTTVTIMAAMVSKSRGKEALLTVIAFPIVLPVLWVAIKSTRHALEKNSLMPGMLVFLLAFSGGMGLLSLLLFKFIWLEE